MEEENPKTIVNENMKKNIDIQLAKNRIGLEQLKRQREEIEKEYAEMEDAMKSIKFYLYQWE